MFSRLPLIGLVHHRANLRPIAPITCVSNVGMSKSFRSLFKSAFKAAVRLVGLRWKVFHVYCVSDPSVSHDVVASCGTELTLRRAAADDLAAIDDVVLHDQMWYQVENASTFIAYNRTGMPIGLCFAWPADVCRRKMGWLIGDADFYLPQIIVSPKHQGAKAGTALWAYASAQLLDAGARRLYSRAWFSHMASIRMHERSGWSHVATTYELFLGSVRLIRTARCRRQDLAPIDFWLQHGQ